MLNIIWIFFLVIIILGIIIYLYFIWNLNFFKKRNIPHILNPKPFFGNVKERLLLKISFSEMQIKLYKELSGYKYGGFFEGRREMLMIRDPELLRILLVRDFDCFVDRLSMSIRPEQAEEQMLLFLRGSQWKNVRTITTPIFSSGKMKLMSNLIVKCTNQMINYLDNYNDNIIEMKDLFGRFTLDTISSCAFGIQTDSLQNSDAEFINIISKFNDITTLQRIKLFLSVVIVNSSTLAKLLNVTFFNREVLKYISAIVLQTKELRQKEAGNNLNSRIDFIQLMLEAQMGELKSLDKDTDLYARDAELKSTSTQEKLTDKQIIGQSILFLLAGYETSSTLLTFASYEIAQNNNIQEKIKEEIKQVLNKYQGQLCYDALSDMTYLENVLNETLRKYPPVSRIERVCTVDKYQLPETDVVLKKGDIIAIPICGLHTDPKYYPEPNLFNPDRFLKENKQNRSPYVFLPFGSGPRNCIGMRFAMMSSKMAVASLLNNFTLEICSKTEIPCKISKKSVFLKSENGIHLKIKRG